MNRPAWVGTALTTVLALGSLAVLTVGGGDGNRGGQVASTSATPFVTRGCVGCHTLGSQSGNHQVGPDLTALDEVAASRVEGLTAEEYVRQSIREPQAYVVPGYGLEMPTLSLSDAEIDEIVALLLTADQN